MDCLRPVIIYSIERDASSLLLCGLAYVDQGYTGERAAQAAQAHGVRLEIIKHTEAKRSPISEPISGI
jgi:hypothetical protein